MKNVEIVGSVLKREPRWIFLQRKNLQFHFLPIVKEEKSRKGTVVNILSQTMVSQPGLFCYVENSTHQGSAHLFFQDFH